VHALLRLVLCHAASAALRAASATSFCSAACTVSFRGASFHFFIGKSTVVRILLRLSRASTLPTTLLLAHPCQSLGVVPGIFAAVSLVSRAAVRPRPLQHLQVSVQSGYPHVQPVPQAVVLPRPAHHLQVHALNSHPTGSCASAPSATVVATEWLRDAARIICGYGVLWWCKGCRLP